MFLKLRVPLLGLVENMSYHACPRCGHVEHVFGHGGVERAARDYGVEVIGQVRQAFLIATPSSVRGVPVPVLSATLPLACGQGPASVRSGRARTLSRHRTGSPYAAQTT